MDINEMEEKGLISQRNDDSDTLLFDSDLSAGNNSVRLARICILYDSVMIHLGWDKRPLGNFTKLLTAYQASVDTKYHNDFKEVKIAEEIERRRAERKGFSILSK